MPWRDQQNDVEKVVERKTKDENAPEISAGRRSEATGARTGVENGRRIGERTASAKKPPAEPAEEG